MGVSSSGVTSQSARSGDSKIIAQGQTRGDYGNDPDVSTRQSKAGPDERSGTQLRP